MEEELDFGEILERDVANIIAKNIAGAPLNSRERKLIEDEREKRKKPAAKRPAPQTGVRRSAYLHSYDFYAKRYESSQRTVKRWSAIGKKAGDITPLDDPEDFHRWWSEHMTNSPPEGLVKALVEWRKEGKSAPPVSREEDGLPEEDEFDGSGEVTAEERGLEQMLGRLETIEVQLSRKATGPGGAKPWLDTISRITSVITKLREEKEKHAKLIPKDLAETIIHEFHGPVENGVRGMGSDFCRAAGLPWSAKEEAAWSASCDELFKRFGEEVFRAI